MPSGVSALFLDLIFTFFTTTQLLVFNFVADISRYRATLTWRRVSRAQPLTTVSKPLQMHQMPGSPVERHLARLCTINNSSSQATNEALLTIAASQSLAILQVHTIATMCLPIHPNTINHDNLVRQCPDRRIVESAVRLPASSSVARMVRASFEAILLSIVNPPEDVHEVQVHARKRQNATISIPRPPLSILRPLRSASKACMAKRRSKKSRDLYSLLLILPVASAHKLRLWSKTLAPPDIARGMMVIKKTPNVSKY